MQTAVLSQTHSPSGFSGGGVGGGGMWLVVEVLVEGDVVGGGDVGGRGDVVGSGCISGGMDVVTSETGTAGNR